MANPQVENGFVRIAIELFDALCRACLNGQEWRILNSIIRKTYGFNKTWDVIALSQFGEITGMDRKSIIRTIKTLLIKNVILRQEKGHSFSYKLNKNYKQWIVANLPRGESATVGVASHAELGVASHAELGVARLPHTIDNRQKTIEIFNLSDEINGLKKLGWDGLKIKKHLLMREIPEADIDKAMGKHF